MATLVSDAVALNELHYIRKCKLYKKYIDAVKNINKLAIEEDDLAPSSFVLSDEIVSNLIRIDKTIYNVKNKNNPLLFTCGNPYFNDVVYCYNTKQEGFNYCIEKFGMYFCGNKPILFLEIAPFNIKQHNILIENIGVKY